MQMLGFHCNGVLSGAIKDDMKKISTAADLELLRRYAELGRWTAATSLYFDACLEGLDAAGREELHEAVWARDGHAVTAAIDRLAGASRFIVNHGRVKPLPPGVERTKALQGAEEKRA
jgi:hypothetical protein